MGTLLALLEYLDSWDIDELAVSDEVQEAVSLSVSDVFCVSTTSCDITRPSVGHVLISDKLLLDVIRLVVLFISWFTCLFQI